MSSADRSDPDFGARMRRAREAHGVSLRQIAETTKLSVRALEALERNDISLLPGGIFSRAFVRAYASEVGMDPEKTVRDFITQFPHDSVTIGSPHVPPDLDTEGEGRRRMLGIVAMVLALIVIVAAGALYVMSRQ
jgi:cytoskeletal protein RodZ